MNLNHTKGGTAMTGNKFFVCVLLAGCLMLLGVMMHQKLYSQHQFALTSSAFSHNANIPHKYTCAGANRSTPLEWSKAPAGTKSFALIMDDPDAQRVIGYTWVHWVVYNIPAQTTRLPEGLPAHAKIALGNGTTITQGITSWKKSGYGGPCPPKGTGVHHYQYRLMALSIEPTLPEGLSKDQLLNAVKGSIIAEAKLTGTFEKK
jgi:hypothetical protein